MKAPNNPYLPYAEIAQQKGLRALLQTQVPVEHAVSVPLPTKRWQVPGYACFAAPALRVPDQPARQGAPDRWWVIDARSGRLIAYALCRAVPFGSTAGEDVTLRQPGHSVEALRELFAHLRAQIGAQAPDFFDGKTRPAAERNALKELLEAAVPAVLMPRYRELTPDFFAWLDQG